MDHRGCIGKPLPKGMTGVPKVARTSYVPLGHCELPYPVSRYPSARISLVDCTPHTGRYHQIRLHFRHFRHPIIGDSQHGDKPQNRAFAAYTGTPGLLLHARRFAFDHPDGGRLTLTAEVPPAWRRWSRPRRGPFPNGARTLSNAPPIPDLEGVIFGNDHRDKTAYPGPSRTSPSRWWPTTTCSGRTSGPT